jgi:hypothetical protein
MGVPSTPIIFQKGVIMADGNRWRCLKCNSTNSLSIPRCSFCSEPRPGTDVNVKQQVLDKLTKDLHNAIEKLSPQQKQKMWRWLEDNLL